MRDYGLEETLQELGEYVFGKTTVPVIPYEEDGDWEKFLPTYECQTTLEGDETFCCTVFGTLNAIETLDKRIYGQDTNYSERFTALTAGLTGAKGANPHVVCEAIRKEGVVPQQFLPMTRDKESFFDISRLTGSIRARGQYWLQVNEFMHEWVWEGGRSENYIDLLREALKTSPVGVSVSAWREVDGVYVSDNGGNNHWCLLYKIDDEGYPWVFDSYDHSKKKLSKDHNIRRAKRFWLGKRTKPAMKKHIALLEKILNFLMNRKTFLSVCTEALGTDVTPLDETDDSVACVDTLSTLMRKVDPAVPHMVSTIALYAWLDNPSHGYREVDLMEPGDIIISPTSGARTGHCGVCMEDYTIASNNSFGTLRGKFTKNYTKEIWDKRYTDTLKLSRHVFRKVV